MLVLIEKGDIFFCATYPFSVKTTLSECCFEHSKIFYIVRDRMK